MGRKALFEHEWMSAHTPKQVVRKLRDADLLSGQRAETSTQHTDPRIAEAAAGISFIAEMFPDFVGMLPQRPTRSSRVQPP